MATKIQYLKDRISNAFWMLRRGDLRAMIHAARVELAHRREAAKNARMQQQYSGPDIVLEEFDVPSSDYSNGRKVLPPSYRPTESSPVGTRCSTDGMIVDKDAVATQIKTILENLAVEKESTS